MAHLHTCEDCGVEFACDLREIDSAYRQGCSVEPDRCIKCALVYDAEQEQIRDRTARLIVAAPEMYEALKLAERCCPCGARPETLTTHPHVGGCLIGAALARAEGRS